MYMTLGRLKALIADLPDDTLIVQSGPDHSYELANIALADAERVGRGFVQYFGPDYAESPDNPVVRVLVVA